MIVSWRGNCYCPVQSCSWSTMGNQLRRAPRCPHRHADVPEPRGGATRSCERNRVIIDQYVECGRARRPRRIRSPDGRRNTHCLSRSSSSRLDYDGLLTIAGRGWDDRNAADSSASSSTEPAPLDSPSRPSGPSPWPTRVASRSSAAGERHNGSDF